MYFDVFGGLERFSPSLCSPKSSDYCLPAIKGTKADMTDVWEPLNLTEAKPKLSQVKLAPKEGNRL